MCPLNDDDVSHAHAHDYSDTHAHDDDGLSTSDVCDILHDVCDDNSPSDHHSDDTHEDIYDDTHEDIICDVLDHEDMISKTGVEHASIHTLDEPMIHDHVPRDYMDDLGDHVDLSQ